MKDTSLSALCQINLQLTAQQKLANLELMLGQITMSVSSTTTVWCVAHQLVKSGKNKTSFRVSVHRAHFLNFAEFKLDHDEQPEDLYQHMLAFLEDNLLHSDGNIIHHGKSPSKNEIISPSFENLLVLTWLQLLHKDLPKLVKQRYGMELRTRTSASIKPEISQALDSLLDKIKGSHDAHVMRSNMGLSAPTDN